VIRLEEHPTLASCMAATCEAKDAVRQPPAVGLYGIRRGRKLFLAWRRCFLQAQREGKSIFGLSQPYQTPATHVPFARWNDQVIGIIAVAVGGSCEAVSAETDPVSVCARATTLGVVQDVVVDMGGRELRLARKSLQHGNSVKAICDADVVLVAPGNLRPQHPARTTYVRVAEL